MGERDCESYGDSGVLLRYVDVLLFIFPFWLVWMSLVGRGGGGGAWKEEDRDVREVRNEAVNQGVSE